MKENEKKMTRIKSNIFIPPFLRGFNVQHFNTPLTDINLEIVNNSALDLLKKVSFDNETTSETIVRTLENYLLLISLVKVYQLLCYDAELHQTTSRIDKLKSDFMKRFSGMNAHFLEELDTLIAQEIEPTRYDKVKRTLVKDSKKQPPVISKELILPALNNTSYENVLNKIVEEGIFPPSFVKNLTPKNEFGLLALTIYKGTMSLIEAELRELIERERFKIHPQSLNELFDRMHVLANEIG